MLYCKTNPEKTLDTCGCPDCITNLKDINAKATAAMVIMFDEYLKKSGREKEWQEHLKNKKKAA